MAHPLDPLCEAEIKRVAARVHADFGDEQRFIETLLEEPSKEELRAFAADARRRPPRVARATTWTRATNSTRVTTVDLGRDAVVASNVRTDVQPANNVTEYAIMEGIVRADPQFRAAMETRGLDVAKVHIDPWCVGHFSAADDAQKGRMFFAVCYYRRNPGDLSYGAPIEGIRAVGSMTANKLVSFHDDGAVPLPPAPPGDGWVGAATHGRRRSRALKPLAIAQPDGASFRVDGHAVAWDCWRFRVGFTPREGLVLHGVGWQGAPGAPTRPVAHRLSFNEMVVPYGDPDFPHYMKNAFDAGEDGLGKNANSLELGCDCLGTIHYWDAALATYAGGAETIRHAVCMHEEDASLLWKHSDWATGRVETRRSRRLVVSFFCTVANYDYGFYWYLYQDGTIEADVKCTGVLSVGALREGESSRPWGTVVAPRVYAPCHQHHFVARLDMAVDGSDNTVEEVDVVADPVSDPRNVHRNGFRARATRVASEREAGRDANAAAARVWKVASASARNALGAPTAYKLIPRGSWAPPIAKQADYLRRAPFLRRALWVTRYARGERYASGEFPNQRGDGRGITAYVRQGRPLVAQDVVLWHVFGLTHVPRPEDWPMMPVEHTGFVLAPFGFHAGNPAGNVAPARKDDGFSTSTSTSTACCGGSGGGEPPKSRL